MSRTGAPGTARRAGRPTVRAILVCAALSLAAAPAGAAPAALAPGEYLAEGGGGRLVIERGPGNTRSFVIETVGPNGHSCDLNGVLDGNRARLTEEGFEGACIVDFEAGTEGITVSERSFEACRRYCGARAGFEHLYLKVAPACREAAVARTRKTFKTLYDRRDHAAARRALEPVLQRCERTLHWLDLGWIRNDLAINDLRLGEPAVCLRRLQPLQEDAARTDAEIRENLPPLEAEVYTAVLGATRTNLRLCRKTPGAR